ncbi:hypothetical protein [Aurantiacibacter sediminis]|nr:hypothetical protein [Aurantiacibacter sediminis]
MEWQGTASHRDGDYAVKSLFEGEPGPDNYWFVLFRVSGKYDTPRHAHNFEQVRIMLEGAFDFGDQVQEEGTVGYFCEGTPYAQTARGDSVTLLLQCEGASRSRYLNISEQRAAGEAMVEAGGTFSEGLYDGPNGRGGTMKRDGALALWEWECGSRPTIPPAKFENPVIMHPDRFVYRGAGDGLEEKHLATFGERDLSLTYVKVAAGSSFSHDTATSGDALFYALDGSGTVEGEAFFAGCAAEARAGDVFSFEADQSTTLIRLRLPS